MVAPRFLLLGITFSTVLVFFGVLAFAQSDLPDRCADAGLSHDAPAAACSDKWLAISVRGWAEMAAGLFNAARSDFYKVGRFESEAAKIESSLGLGALAWEFESFALARQLASDVLEMNPVHAQALHLHGVASGAIGDFETAMADAGKLIALAPNDPVGHALMGLLYHNRAVQFGADDDFEAALTSYENALGLGGKPNAGLLRRYSWLLSTGPDEIRDTELALVIAQQAFKEQARVSTVPRHAALFHHTLAVALASNGRTREAEIQLEAAIERFPGARSRFQKALKGAGFLDKETAATLYELLGAIHACLEVKCGALNVPLIYKTL